MNFQSSSRQPSTTNPYAAAPGPVYGGNSSGTRLLKRLFKFGQMDFELALWEISSLMLAPKKVFKNMYYNKQTRNTYTTSDPALPYLLSLLLALTSLAWSLAYAPASPGAVFHVAAVFVFGHCLIPCLALALLNWIVVPRLLGPSGVLVGSARRGGGRGLFAATGLGLAGEEAAEGVELGYAFDVAIRAFVPIWVYLYVLQLVFMYLLQSSRWFLVLLSNTLHLVAFAHTTYVSFLGYNSLPSLSRPQLLLAPPLAVGVFFWVFTTIGGWSATRHLAPILWTGGVLRKPLG